MGHERPSGQSMALVINGVVWRPTNLVPDVLGPSEEDLLAHVTRGGTNSLGRSLS